MERTYGKWGLGSMYGDQNKLLAEKLMEPCNKLNYRSARWSFYDSVTYGNADFTVHLLQAAEVARGKS